LQLQLNDTQTNKRGVYVMLSLICVGIVGFLFAIPSAGSKFVGGCFIVIGAFNILLHQILGRHSYNSARSMPPLISKFWERNGLQGAQFLYLGIGIAVVTAGVFLVVRPA
jgi:hypothetical protein